MARYLSSSLRHSLAMSVPCSRQEMVSADKTLYLPAPTASRVVSHLGDVKTQGVFAMKTRVHTPLCHPS